MTALRLKLLVSAKWQDPDAYVTALRALEGARQDRLGDHLGYWLLLTQLGQQNKAAEIIRSHSQPPRSALDALRMAQVLVALNQGDEAGRYLERFVEDFPYSIELWLTHAEIMIKAREWERLRALSIKIRSLDLAQQNFVGYGYFSLFGSFLAELFPTSVRATGQGLTYNLGRGLGALAPYTIGYVATLPNVGIGSALALTSAFFLAGAVLILFFADTSRKSLVESA